jgi:hypothetical protein
MDKFIYLASDGETNSSSSLHTSLDDAAKTGSIYIDVFEDGKHVDAFKRIDWERCIDPKGSYYWKYSELPRYSDDPNQWDHKPE